jgi:transposase InsO family protein
MDAANLITRLRTRLDTLECQCMAFSEAWLRAPTMRALRRIERLWGQTWERLERTRKTLVRAEYGIPYWRFAQEWNRQHGAEFRAFLKVAR